MTQIRTLGLYQPFATLMLHGKIETRWVQIDKKAPFPLGKYLIYATKKRYRADELHEFCSQENVNDIADIFPDDPTSNLTGSAICIGDLVEVRDMTFHDKKLAFVEHSGGIGSGRRMVVLIFKNMKRIKPFPFKGKQGVGFLSKEDEAKIEYLTG